MECCFWQIPEVLIQGYPLILFSCATLLNFEDFFEFLPILCLNSNGLYFVLFVEMISLSLSKRRPCLQLQQYSGLVKGPVVSPFEKFECLFLLNLAVLFFFFEN